MSLTMSKVSDEAYEQEWIRRTMQAQQMEEDNNDDEKNDTVALTSEGDGSDREPEAVVYCNIQEIVPGLFIGDYTAAIDGQLLKEKNITFVVAAMRQRYTPPENIRLHRIMIDDTAKTNIIRYFKEVNSLIRQARANGENVLVHCQAGVSRSTTLCTAFLMEEFDMTVDDAIDKIASVRSVVSPIEFFLHQLELYERCEMDPDPSKYPEYRRFLMNYMAQDMLDGDGVDQLILAYYPTPAPSPRRSPGLPDPFLSMTPMSGTAPGTPATRSRRGSSVSITSHEARSEIIARVRRPSSGAMSGGLSMTSMSGGGSAGGRRLSDGQHVGGDMLSMTRRKSSRTKSSGERSAEIQKLRTLLEEKRKMEAAEVANKQKQDNSDASKATVSSAHKIPYQGRKLRCKMCRRELAAREHILEHEVGQGQRAFAPKRRDMTQHRKEAQKKKEDKEKEIEARRLERQRLASEAADDILQEAEEAIASDSEDEEDGVAEAADPAKKKAASSATQQTPTKPAQQPSASPAADKGATPRSLASRLPPALAALRVAMPQPMSHDYNASGSAIEDDEPTPITESPPSPPLLPSSMCTSYFTEPLSWMRPLLESGDLTGKIICPNTKCGAKLGNFDWSGLRCSCAAWICPGFALSASKVDEVKF